MTEVIRLRDEARLDEGSASAALLRFIDLFDDLPPAWIRVAATATDSATAAEAAQLHGPLLSSLTALVSRGQASGEFDANLPVAWLADATVALGHTAYELESRGGLSHHEARATLRISLLRLYGVTEITDLPKS